MNSYLIVGLGNPGKSYEKTRHNVGFRVIDIVAHQLHLSSFKRDQKKFNSDYAIGRMDHKQLFLVKPLTYMNRSGIAVRQWVDYYQIPYSHILVILDDIALPFGKIRFRAKGSSGGHNGLQSVIDHLGTDAFPRLRIGIGNQYPKGKQVQYVLSRFTRQEEIQLDRLLLVIAEAVIAFIENGINYVMNKFNGRDLITST